MSLLKYESNKKSSDACKNLHSPTVSVRGAGGASRAGYESILNGVTRIHLIGIGGSGMCPLAEILHSEGFHITGSDANASETLDRIIKQYNIPVIMGHHRDNIKDAELVVYSAAIKQNNCELESAREKGIPCVERSVLLGDVTRRYNRSIAVSGTHGKTTTTAMLSQILIGSGFDPSAIIGGKLPFIGGNSYVGQSDIIVCEACEYVNSFLQLTPYISIILNVDADHLDFFKNLDDIKKSFRKFAGQTTGLLIINGDDLNTLDTVSGLEIKKITYGLQPQNDYYAASICSGKGVNEQFDLMFKGEKLTSIKLIVPGQYNIYNALAAAAAAHYLGATSKEISENLHKFGGVHRRFEILGKIKGITVADDFAHHPTELTATLNAAMNMGFKRVWAVFQPHTYSRTSILLEDFAKALTIPDKVIITEILAVREKNTYNIRSEDLSSKIEGALTISTFEEVAEHIRKRADDGDLVLTLGGGNIYMCANMILGALRME